MVKMRAGGWGQWKSGKGYKGGALGEEVASVEHGRTHKLHGNGLIFLSVAVWPAAHMVMEWTGCADDQRWGGELERGGGDA